MAISDAQKTAMQDIMRAILNFTQGGRYKRHLHEIFLDLPDREDFEDYYRIIPQPRCLNDIQLKLGGSAYKDPLDVYHDLNLVFLNAVYYNEDGSQVHSDASRLKVLLDTEWKARTVLPQPRASPPPDSAQKVHYKPPKPAPAAAAPPPRLTPPKPAATPIAPAPAPVLAPAPPAPIASTSYKPLPQPAEEPEPDEGEDYGDDVAAREEEARDGESETIVRQLEKGLPRWEGFGAAGWMEDASNERMLEIVQAVKGYKDVVGNRYAEAIDSLPEDTRIAEVPYVKALSFKLIENKIRQGVYANAQAFDQEMTQLFLKARRSYEPATEPYARALLLQRLYQHLADLPAATPIQMPIQASSTHFASVRAGPGTVLHALEAVTTFRVSVKDRAFVEELTYKGQTLRLADWVHIANPDDPGRPIVGQVFRLWLSEDPKTTGKPGISVCWYYRPEQTFHPAHRQFWQNEVFKTGHFADHSLPDVLEKIACQFTARHIRGRPRPPYWHPGFPLYVCDSRYNDRERVFVRIKNWNSCVPEEVRKNPDFMPIYPFERIVYPRRVPSPFTPGAQLVVNSLTRGLGGLGEPIERAEGEKIEGGGTGRRRAGKAREGKASATDVYGPQKGLYVGAQQQAPQYAQQQPAPTPVPAQDRTVVGAAGGWQVLKTNASASKLPADTAKLFDRDPETGEVLWFAAPPMNMARVPAPRHSLVYLHHLATKRRQAQEGMDVDEREGSGVASKRPRVAAPPRTSDAINALWEEVFGQE